MSLDLSLPEPPPRKGGRALALATLVSSLLAVALLLVILLRAPAGKSDPNHTKTLTDRNLAELLEKRTLWSEAAGLWEEVAENGEDLFRAGKCRMLAGEPERAARNLLAAEAQGLSEPLAAESSRLVLEAYAMLGKFDVRNQALKRRTGGGDEEKSDLVAQVGEDAITRAELIAAVRDEEVARLLGSGRLDREALDQAVAARTADPRMLLPTLSRLLSTRALALSALADGQGESPVLARRLREIRDQLLANLLLEDRLLEGVRISDADLQDYYQAHLDRYTARAAARLSFGEDPQALTEVEGWHEQGAPYPEGLPRSAEADAMLFALTPGGVSERAVRIGDREVYLKLLELRPARQLSLAEAREQVTSDLLARKRMEVVDAMRAKVQADHPFKILDPDLRKAWQEGEAGGR